jgi:hypothetical protein
MPDAATAPARATPEQVAAATRWNERYPVGTAVEVHRDQGNDTVRTKTTSRAWLLGDGTPVVMVEATHGCYSLERVTPIVPVVVDLNDDEMVIDVLGGEG